MVSFMLWSLDSYGCCWASLLRYGVWILANVVERISIDNHFLCIEPYCPSIYNSSWWSYVGVVEEDNNIFGVGASIEESSCALVVGELSLFRRLFVVLATIDDPLAWWCIHETQFRNVGFLAKKLFEISGSHWNWTCLQSCWHVDNFLMLLVTSGRLRLYHCVVKNWSNDPQMNCMWHKDMKGFYDSWNFINWRQLWPHWESRFFWTIGTIWWLGFYIVRSRISFLSYYYFDFVLLNACLRF